MTSRERVLRTIAHQPVDRMPIDFGSSTSTNLSAFAYAKLLEYLGYPQDPIDIIDVTQCLPRVSEAVRRRFHADCIHLHPGWTATQTWSPRPGYKFLIPASAKLEGTPEGQWVLTHQYGSMRMPSGGFFFDGVWGSARSFEPWSGDEYIARMAAEAKRLYEETEYYVSFPGFPCYFATDPDWLCDLMTDPEMIAEKNRKNLEAAKGLLLKVYAACGETIQEIRISDDMGTQRGPWCRPEIMEQEIMPFYKEFCTFAHDNSPYKVHLHCCGSILPLIPMLADCGMDIIDPIQISADNMAPADVKKAAGKMTLWGGGIDTQHVIKQESPEAVAEHVRGLVSAFKPGGGYVFASVHNIQGNVSPENIVAAFDAAYEMAGDGGA